MMQCKNKRASKKETHGDHEEDGSLLEHRSQGVTTAKSSFIGNLTDGLCKTSRKTLGGTGLR